MRVYGAEQKNFKYHRVDPPHQARAVQSVSTGKEEAGSSDKDTGIDVAAAKGTNNPDAVSNRKDRGFSSQVTGRLFVINVF